jgi:hypothetical protein
MKALEDALGVADFPAQFEILEAIPAKDYPLLLKAAAVKTEMLREERRTAHDADELDRTARNTVFYQKLLVIEAAQMIAYQAKAKLPPKFRPSNELLEKEETVAFLSSRSPAWLPALFLSQRKSHRPVGLVYRYLRAGVIPPPPEGDLYYGAIPEFIWRQAEGRMAQAKQFIRDHCELVTRDLHLTVRIAGTNSYSDPFYIPQASYWDGVDRDFSVMKLVAELAAAGDIEIPPFLRTITETLIDARREFDAQAVLRLHEELAPTPNQCLEAQNSYFALLAGPHKNFVRFGIDVIATFSGLHGFDAAGFVDHVSPVFLHPSNPLQLAGLKLIKAVVTDSLQVADRIPAVVAPVLLNPDPKVQAAVLAVLKVLPASTASRITGSIAPFADRILATLRPGFEGWLRSEVHHDPVEPQSPGNNPLETGGRLQPVASPEDLVFIASELLNRNAEPTRFELFLDGLARHAAENRDTLVEAFSPLQKRALHIASGRDSKGGCQPVMLIFAGHLILHFSSNEADRKKPAEMFGSLSDTSVWPAKRERRCYSGIMEFARSRVGELLLAIDKGRSMPHASTPEFELGFIRAATLVERIRACSESGLAPPHFDFIQAIARCLPAGDEGGHLELPTAADEASRVVHFLLSGEVRGKVLTPAWWLTAARTREHFGDFSAHPHFSKYHLPDEPDWSVPATYPKVSQVGFNWRETFGPEQSSGDDDPADHLYPLQHSPSGGSGIDIRWRNTFTPGFLDAAVAQDIKITYPYLSYRVAERDAPAVVMAEYAMRRLPLRHTMQVHLLVAMNSPGPAEREAATDLLIQASRDGRLAGVTTEMGVVFSELLRGGNDYDSPVIQFNRMLPCFRQLSVNGQLLRIQLREILLQGLKNPPDSVPKGFSGLLELLLELVLAHPPERSIDLNTAWGGMLDGKSKSLAARISKA